MTNSSRANTPCHMQRPSLIEDDGDDHTNNKNGKPLLSRSLTFDKQPLKQKQIKRLTRPSPAIIEQQLQCLGRSLLSNDNWRQETMADVRVNAKAIEKSDQNILFGKDNIFIKNKSI
ncbi:unnamed protein product [Rotaria sordida]|uniref:Uncharacterized protein n=1 Tax=Rotaria sordida TaxID=392033 RepID=A0A820HW13_9BILA|nr:unnamed protein product [Rotaria sordida]